MRCETCFGFSLRTGLGIALCCAVSSSAFAAGKAAAEALYDQGRELLAEERYAEACAALEASQELEAGVGTLLYLGSCYERQNRTASAWATFREAQALAESRADDRADLATQRWAALESKLTKIILSVPEAHRLTGLEVRIDQQKVPLGSWGIPIPVDPGKRVVEATAPGHVPLRMTVSVADEGELYEVDIPRLDRSSNESPQVTSGTQPILQSKLPLRDAEASFSRQRTLAWSLVGTGAASVMVGSVLGLQAKSKNDDSKAECSQNIELCSSRGVELREDAQRFALGANVAFAVGGGLIAAGTVLFLTAPSNRARLTVRPNMSARGAEMSIGGAF